MYDSFIWRTPGVSLLGITNSSSEGTKGLEKKVKELPEKKFVCFEDVGEDDKKMSN